MVVEPAGTDNDMDLMLWISVYVSGTCGTEEDEAAAPVTVEDDEALYM